MRKNQSWALFIIPPRPAPMNPRHAHHTPGSPPLHPLAPLPSTAVFSNMALGQQPRRRSSSIGSARAAHHKGGPGSEQGWPLARPSELGACTNKEGELESENSLTSTCALHSGFCTEVIFFNSNRQRKRERKGYRKGFFFSWTLVCLLNILSSSSTSVHAALYRSRLKISAYMTMMFTLTYFFLLYILLNHFRINI